MSSSLSGLFRRNRTLSFGLLALLLVSALFLLVTPPTSADSPVEGKDDATHPLYADAKRAALSDAIAAVDSRSIEADSQAFTPCTDGMAGDYPCDKVDLLSFMSVDDIGGSNTNDIWGWTDPDNGNEYALIGRTNGASFVDVTDPENPVYLGNVPGYNGTTSSWRDIKVYENYAFIVSEAAGHGMQIFDLTRLRNVANPPETFVEDAHYAGWGNAHNIVINEDSGYAYGVGTDTCSAGLDMVNISDPLNPVAEGCFSEDGYTHDAQCVNYMGPDADHAGSEICLNSNEDTLTIVDVNDKDNPVQLSRETYPNPGYTHQGWLTDDQRYFLQNDETDETSQGINTRTLIWDLVDLDNPVLIGTYDSGLPASDHNLYIRGNYVYQSNYASGLQILDISDIGNANLERAAYFDVWPTSDAAGFDGTWSNYPYFESGNIIVTSRALGFMVVRANLDADFTLSSSPASQDVCIPDDAVYSVEVGSFEGFSDDVNLTLNGAPAGAGVSFSMNDMAPPFSSTLMITTTGVTAGSYDMTIVGMSMTNTHESMISLNLAAATAGDVTLMSPADAATDVLRMPTFEWMAASEAAGYHLEVATDMGFTDVVIDVMLAETSYEAGMSLAPLTTYYWRVTAMNACGEGNTSDEWSFTTEDAPPILVVDDQNNDSAVLPMWTEALDALSAEYDVFDTTVNGGDPDTDTMAPYDVVIHFTGYDWDGTSGPDGDAAGAYLDMGTADAQKCMFISSQDFLWGQGGGGDDILTPFMMDYLGASEGQSDVGHTTAVGAGPFALLGPYTLDFPFPNNYSDRLEADDTASTAFVGSEGNAAVSKVAEGYRTSWWGFPWEAIPSADERQDAMRTILDWCAGIEIDTGMLEGTVTDADTDMPIEGAMVSADNGAMTMTDADGNYSMALVPGTYEVTAEADNYQSEMASDVAIMADMTTMQDFMLAGSHLTYSPDMIEEWMLTDEMVTTTVMLTNSGPLDVEFMLDIEFADEGMEIVNLTIEPNEAPAAESTNSNLANLFAGLNSGKSIQSQPSIAGGNVELILDDGSTDNAIGIGGGQLVWLNRFTPDQYPFNLTEVQVLFGNSGVDVGELVDIYVYEDTDGDGDPATNATHLHSIHDAAVQANDSSTWSVYELDMPLMLNGPGDVLITVVNRTAGINDGEFPAEIDQTASQQRSWTGIYTATPADPPVFPADGAWGIIDDLNADLAGNWMIRGYGQTGDMMDPWATVMPDGGMIPAGGTTTVEVVFNSTGITETGTYTASLMFDGNYVNDVADMPLTMHIIEDDGDGVDGDEECMVNDECDGNGDGMADDMQANATSLHNEGTNGDSGYVTIASPEGTSLVDVETMTAPDMMPDGVDSMPQGIFGFTVEGVDPGAEVMVTIYMHEHEAEMTGYWKHDEMTDMWHDYSENATIDLDAGTITLTLVDGGMGDHDGEANGTIVDPGAPTVTADVTSISLADFNGQANVLWQPVALLALLLLTVMAGGAVMLRKRGLA